MKIFSCKNTVFTIHVSKAEFSNKWQIITTMITKWAMSRCRKIDLIKSTPISIVSIAFSLLKCFLVGYKMYVCIFVCIVYVSLQKRTMNRIQYAFMHYIIWSVFAIIILSIISMWEHNVFRAHTFLCLSKCIRCFIFIFSIFALTFFCSGIISLRFVSFYNIVLQSE